MERLTSFIAIILIFTVFSATINATAPTSNYSATDLNVSTPENLDKNDTVTVYFFYSSSCPHCREETPFLEELERRYPKLEVKYLEVGKNVELFEELCKEYDTIAVGVPRTFIGNKVFIGFTKGGGELVYHQGYRAYIGYKNQIELAILECLNLTCPLRYENAVKISKNDSLVEELLKENPNSLATVKLMNNSYLVAWWTPQRLKSNLQYPDVLVRIDRKTEEILSSEIPTGKIEGIEKPVQEASNIHIFILSAILIYLVAYSVLKERIPLGRYWAVGFLTLLIISGFIFALTTHAKFVENFAKRFPFPAFVFVVALIDGFNPCAFTVLIVLLSLLTYTKSKRRMCLIGTTFIFTSGIMYFIFISLILLAGSLIFDTYGGILMKLIGIVVIIAGIINVKDFFFFRKGISLGISEKYRGKISRKSGEIVRKVKRAESERTMTLAMVGVIFLAIFVNLVELGCTAMLPMIYLAALFQNYGQEVGIHHYLYTAFYSLVYIIPLFAILGNFLYSFKSERLTERQGRILKLIGGLLMLILGILLIFKPELLMFGD